MNEWSCDFDCCSTFLVSWMHEAGTQSKFDVLLRTAANPAEQKKRTSDFCMKYDGQTRFCSRTVHFYLQHVDADADAGIIFFHPSVFLFVHTPRCRGREEEP